MYPLTKRNVHVWLMTVAAAGALIVAGYESGYIFGKTAAILEHLF